MVDGGGFGYGCVDGACVNGGGCPVGIACGGTCVTPGSSLDDCGSCQNACADSQVCYKGSCRDGQGTGASCASPFVVPPDDDDFESRTAAFTGMHTFSCGPLAPVPTRFFRWTAPHADKIDLKVRIALPTDNYVLEVFSAASCDAAARLACNDDKTADDLRPEVTFQAEGGKTYFVALGRIAATSPKVAIHFDD
jgi:hypothetical protein